VTSEEQKGREAEPAKRKYFAKITIELEAFTDRDAANIAADAAYNCEEEPGVLNASVDFTERAST
jgi:hypothetical protein